MELNNQTSSISSTGGEKMCDSCRQRPAINTGETGRPLCGVCHNIIMGLKGKSKSTIVKRNYPY